MTRATKKPAPARPFHTLPTLEDYGLKPRGELPGESWVRRCQMERAYTMGFRAGILGTEHLVKLAGSVSAACPFSVSDHRRGFWLLGVNDGTRVRERRASK